MASITNAPFRLVARECGSGLVTSEEIDAAALFRGGPRRTDVAAYYPEERPLAMQLLGCDAELLVRAGRLLEERGADIVDLNMGCPVPKIVSRGKGAALMRDIPAAARLLRALRRALRVPLTVKIRGGWDDAHVNAVEVARMAEAEGVDAVTVHPRTRSQLFTGKAPWTVIAEVVDAVRIPVTGNGDVRSMADARRMAAETGCRSVMIGRGALGRPWIFDESWDDLPPEARRPYIERVIARHLDLIRAHFDEHQATVQTKKHLAWYAEGFFGAAACRAEIFRARSGVEAWEAFQRYWTAAVPLPVAVVA
jgi:nifR3 family TIM-barrel protein